MQASVATTSPIERTVTITVPASEVDHADNALLLETAKTVRLNGFRKGHVPMAVVQQRYGKDVRNEIVGEIMRQHYVPAVTENELNPAGWPKIDATVDEAGKDLEFVATLEIYPEIELKPIEGAEIERPQAEVTDADVEEMIETLRKQNASWTDVERAAADGDQVKIDFEGFLGEEAFEGGKAEGHELVLGSNSFIPGFEEQLVGAAAGDDKEIKVSFPADYQAEHLAGQEATFKVKVHAVKAQELPEVNEEFIAQFGLEAADVESFKVEVKKNMQRELKNAIENRVKQQVLAELTKANDILVPQALADQEIDGLKRQAAQQFGLGEDFDVSQLPGELFQDQAVQRVKTGLLLSEVVSSNEMDVSDEELNARVEEMAQQYQDPAQVTEYYGSNEQARNQLKSVLLEEKAVDKLLAQAQVKDVAMSYQEALQAAQQQEEAEEEATEAEGEQA